MESGFEQRQRISKWLADIASTEESEVDCEALEALLETIVAIGARGDEIRAALPQIALHLEHCPECGDWYEAMLALIRESP